MYWRYWCRTFDEIELAKLAETLAKRATSVFADGVEYRVVAEHGCETVARIRRMTSNSTSGLRSRWCEAANVRVRAGAARMIVSIVGRESTTYLADVLARQTYASLALCDLHQHYSFAGPCGSKS